MSTVRQSDRCSDFRIGKRVGHWLYIHVSALALLEMEYQSVVEKAEALTGLRAYSDFNVIKFNVLKISHNLSLLLYEDLHIEPFPALLHSWKIDLTNNRVSVRNYKKSTNPPILHRKELLLSPSDPYFETFYDLTSSLETAGLFRDTKRIGFRRHWHELLDQAGIVLTGHVVLQSLDRQVVKPRIERHKTAIGRSGLSRPFQFLARHGYLDLRLSVFDYGCGKGDDMRQLRENGVEINGWDPFFLPGAELKVTDVVNLGFVINVIENPDERTATLRQAFSLARTVMSVSAMLSNKLNTARFEFFGDGVVTRRKTFQKYFTQLELKEYIEQVLGEEAIAVGPGVFFVFKDKLEEQRFLLRRQQRLVFNIPLSEERVRIQSYGPKTSKTTMRRICRLHEENVYVELLEDLWQRALVLGRPPQEDDLDDKLATAILNGPGGLAKAMRLLWRVRDRIELEATARDRTEDLLVYLALNIFNGRQGLMALPDETRRDIKYFLGSLKTAEAAANTLLFSAGKVEEILSACRQATASGLGWLDAEHSLLIQADLLGRLPPILRVYAGCASRLIGDIGIADVVKFHINSGKLTLLMLDDFFGKAVPEVRSRIKINLRTQGIDFFDYGEGKSRALLYCKSRIMSPDQEGYTEQLECDRQMESLGCFDFSGFGPDPEFFFMELHRHGFSFAGLKLVLTRDNNTYK